MNFLKKRDEKVLVSKSRVNNYAQRQLQPLRHDLSCVHSHLASALMQQRDMLMKDEDEALVPKVVSMPLSRSLVFSSSSI